MQATSDDHVYQAERALLGLSEDYSAQTMDLPTQTRRSFLTGVDHAKREIHFSFSSSFGVKRPYGTEILSHAPSSLNTASLDSGLVMFLRDHDFNQHLGDIISYRLGEDRNFAVARIFPTPEGDELLKDIEAGRNEISCSYKVHEWEHSKDVADSFLVTKWSLMEISSVPGNAAADRSARISKEAAIANMSDDEKAREIARQEVLVAWEAEQEKERLRLLDEVHAKIQYYL